MCVCTCVCVWVGLCVCVHQCVIVFPGILVHTFRGNFAQVPVSRGVQFVLFNPSRTDSRPLQLRAKPETNPDQTMRIRLGLCVLGLLCLHTSVFGQDAAPVQPGVLIFCDDPSVEKAIHSAVSKLNEGLTTGQNLALYQIISASKSENGADSLYSLRFTSRKSDCPVGSDKPWTKCDYLPHGPKVPLSCNASVLMTETEANTQHVYCQSDVITPEKAPCLGCPEDIDQESEDLKVPISVSISRFNTISNSTHLFSLHTVGHATRQVVAGFRFEFSFDMKKTVCAKAEHKELGPQCSHDDNNLEFANCNSTVDTAPWRLESPLANIECDSGPMPPSVLRRRPPGWSPLRKDPVSQKNSSSPAAPNAKEESSEEDTKALKPSASPDAANIPFHCPSKPWKPFNPITDAGPMQDPTGAPPTNSGGFQDTDLVGFA